jgi:signal transduction histidine kinase/GGDEF domain-containing protein
MQEGRSSEATVVQRGDQWFRISVDPLLNEEGNPIGGVHIMADITKEHDIDKIKTELISNVSHELRTPLSTIQEGIALIAEGSLGPLHADQRDMLTRVKNNIDRLSRLINDLLDMSKIEAGRLELKKSSVDISTLVEEVLSSFRNQATDKNIELITLIPNDLHPLYIDGDKISQVLSNLIENSMKFTLPHGRITIGAKDKVIKVEISVADTGIGIAPQHMAGLFDRFSQFNRAYGPGGRGTGLGLTISREIIDMHGGRIWAESEVGKGSTFTFCISRMTEDEMFCEYLNNGLREAQEKECPLSLVAIRIKNIEKLIKTYTNTQIFTILREIEGLIGRTLRRKTDIVSRYKYGEIIIALLMDTAKKDAVFVKERMRQEIEAEMNRRGWPRSIELFLDIVTYPDDAMDEKELVDKIAKGLWTEGGRSVRRKKWIKKGY